MKQLNSYLIFAGFALILLAGILMNMGHNDVIDLFGFTFQKAATAIFLITLGVIFYFSGRILSFILKFTHRND